MTYSPPAQSAATPKTNPGMERGFPDLSFLHQQDWYCPLEVVLTQVKYVDPSALNCKWLVAYIVVWYSWRQISNLPANFSTVLESGALSVDAWSRDGAILVIGVLLYCATRQPSYIRRWYGMAVRASVPEARGYLILECRYCRCLLKFLLIFRLKLCGGRRREEICQVSGKGNRPLEIIFPIIPQLQPKFVQNPYHLSRGWLAESSCITCSLSETVPW